MDDLFYNILTEKGFKLIYTDSAQPALACIGAEGMTIVYANTVFSGCPEKIARAAVSLYGENSGEAYEMLADYVKDFDPSLTVEKTITEGELHIGEILMSREDGSRIPLEDNTVSLDEDTFVVLDITAE